MQRGAWAVDLYYSVFREGQLGPSGRTGKQGRKEEDATGRVGWLCFREGHEMRTELPEFGCRERRFGCGCGLVSRRLASYWSQEPRETIAATRRDDLEDKDDGW